MGTAVPYHEHMFVDVVAEIEAMTSADVLLALRDEVLVQRRTEARIAALVRKLETDRAHTADGHASVRGLLRAEYKASDAEITHAVRCARLIDDLPEVMEALYAGEIGVAQARALGQARSNPRCGDRLVDHADILLGHAKTLCYDDFHLCVRRWEMLADADGAHRAAEATHERRRVSIVEHEGVGHIVGSGGALDTAEMIEIWQRYCDAEFTADWTATTQLHGDEACTALMPRTDAQRRWDALKQIFLDAAATPAAAQRPEPTLNIVIDAATFEATLARMGLVPDPADSSQPPLPQPPVDRWRCETRDGTLVDPCQAVAAALHGHVRRVVLDAAGTVIDLGRRRRLFTGSAREAVLLQSCRCVWPGCHLPAGRCQTDHNQPWQHAGPTRSANGSPLCARHNRWKNHGYHVWRDPNGSWHTYRPDGTEIGTTTMSAGGAGSDTRRRGSRGSMAG